MLLTAEVVRVDKETLKHFKFPLYFRETATKEEILKTARKGCNVGDFLILPSGKTFRRIRVNKNNLLGFRVATEQDMAELVGSQLFWRVLGTLFESFNGTFTTLNIVLYSFWRT